MPSLYSYIHGFLYSFYSKYICENLRNPWTKNGTAAQTPFMQNEPNLQTVPINVSLYQCLISEILYLKSALKNKPKTKPNEANFKVAQASSMNNNNNNYQCFSMHSAVINLFFQNKPNSPLFPATCTAFSARNQRFSSSLTPQASSLAQYPQSQNYTTFARRALVNCIFQIILYNPPTMSLKNSLSQTPITSVRYNEPLSKHCSWRIGGNADVLVEPESVEELAALLRIISKYKLNFVVIGDGSNLLFDDCGFRGVVIKMGRKLSACTIADATLHVQAGIAVPRLARAACLAGLTGLEHTSGIPGTLGGLVAMNGGSLQKGIGDNVKTVRCLDISGKPIELGQKLCEFSYRKSIFLEKSWIVTDVVLELEKGDKGEIKAQMLEILRQRRSKYPRRMPNCGSVFKNHPAIFAEYGPPGKVIEDLGFKGVAVGDAQVSELHANFIVNHGKARSADVLALIRQISEKVYEKTGIGAECEVRYVSPAGKVSPANHLIDY